MISFSRYVNIVSGVGAAAATAERNLITRLFTINPLLPTGTRATFTSADEVAEYFGSDSEEYRRAAFYFSFVSKQATSPSLIDFTRWAKTAVAPHIYGNTEAKVLATYTAIDAGAFSLTMGGVTLNATGLDLSGAASLAAVAALIQTKVRTGTGTQFTAATVAYDATRGSFNLVGGDAVASVITYVDGAQTPLAALGWVDGEGLVVSDGAAIQTVTAVLVASTAANNNFGSFDFMPALTADEVSEAAIWTAAQGVTYMYLQVVAAADAAAWLTAQAARAGGAYTLVSPVSNEYPEMSPGMVLAATDYNRRGAAQNYMFQTFDLTPSVTTDTAANTYDALRLNYYGSTMSAGQTIEFYQRGFLTGGETDPVDMGVYANEMWLKDRAGLTVMNLLLALPQLPANSSGRASLLAALQADVVEPAVFNGTISVGKTLTATQQQYITFITGDPDAWRQVQTIGYWLDVVIAPYTGLGDVTEYKATYTLVYGKADSVRMVEGSHDLI